jgi:hypothetical protein
VRPRDVWALVVGIEEPVAVGVGDRTAVGRDARHVGTPVVGVEESVAVAVPRARRLGLLATEREAQAEEDLAVVGDAVVHAPLGRDRVPQVESQREVAVDVELGPRADVDGEVDVLAEGFPAGVDPERRQAGDDERRDAPQPELPDQVRTAGVEQGRDVVGPRPAGHHRALGFDAEEPDREVPEAQTHIGVDAAKVAVPLLGQRRIGLEQLVILRGDEQTPERPDLHHVALGGVALDPGFLLLGVVESAGPHRLTLLASACGRLVARVYIGLPARSDARSVHGHRCVPTAFGVRGTRPCSGRHRSDDDRRQEGGEEARGSTNVKRGHGDAVASGAVGAAIVSPRPGFGREIGRVPVTAGWSRSRPLGRKTGPE